MRPMKVGFAVVVSWSVACSSPLATSQSVAGRWQNGAFTPSLPQASTYGGAYDYECQKNAILEAFLAKVKAVSARNNQAPPRLDARLCALAVTLTGWNVDQGPPPNNVISDLTYYFGLPEPHLRVQVRRIDTEDVEQIADRLATAVSSVAFATQQRTIGVATARTAKGRSVTVLVGRDADLVLDPVPRQLALGAKAMLSGRVLEKRFDGVATVVSDVQGQMRVTRTAADSAMSTALACGDRPGKILVQIRGERAGQTVTLADFLVSCGEANAAVVTPPPVNAPSVEAAENELLHLVNRERAAVGVSPVEPDSAVSALARGMAAAKNTKPDRGSVADALQRIGVATKLVVHHATRAANVAAAHQSMMASPIHRANVLNPRVTHAGIGVALGQGNKGTELLVTEVLMEKVVAVDINEARNQLRTAIGDKRKLAGVNSLSTDTELDSIAQRYAEALREKMGTVNDAEQKRLLSPLYKGFVSLHVVQGACGEAVCLAGDAKIIAEGKVFGVGAAQGPHPTIGALALYGVVLIGTRK